MFVTRQRWHYYKNVYKTKYFVGSKNSILIVLNYMDFCPSRTPESSFVTGIAWQPKYSKGVHVCSQLSLALNETVRCNFLVHCKLSNTRSQLNRWIRCHSEERYRTFDNKMVFDRVGGFIGRYHLYRPKYDERQENHTKMVSGSVFCGKWS